MQITASGLIIALITGLLGTWLFLTMSATQDKNYRVTETRVACDKARFDVEDAGRHASAELLQIKAEACGEFKTQIADRTKLEEVTKKDNDDLKKSIVNAIASKNGEASKAELAVRGMADEVKQSAIEVKKDSNEAVKTLINNK